MSKNRSSVIAPKKSHLSTDKNAIIIEACELFWLAKETWGNSAIFALSKFISRLKDTSIKPNQRLTPKKATKILYNKRSFVAFLTQADKDYRFEQDVDLLKNGGLNAAISKLILNTDPDQNKKTSFWAGIRSSIYTGTAFLVIGFFASPLASIFFKHQLADLDRQINPEDYPVLKQGAVEDFIPAPKEDNDKKLIDKALPVEIDHFGRDPVTGMGMLKMLEAGRTITLPHNRTKNLDPTRPSIYRYHSPQCNR